jgi:hemolysin activation/secretion protein
LCSVIDPCQGVRSTTSSRSDTLGLRTSEDRIRAVRLGVSADHTDTAGGVNLLDLEYSQGLTALGASDADAPALNGAKPDFSRISAYAARLQNLGGAFSLLVAVSAQASSDKLPTAEQLGLGGDTFLRGYDPSEAIGEQGLAAKFELRFNADFVTASTTWYAYVDSGSVKRQQVSGPALKTSLSSAGAGVRFSGPAGTRGYLEVAKPLGDKVASKNSSSARVFAGFGIDL